MIFHKEAIFGDVWGAPPRPVGSLQVRDLKALLKAEIPAPRTVAVFFKTVILDGERKIRLHLRSGGELVGGFPGT